MTRPDHGHSDEVEFDGGEGERLTADVVVDDVATIMRKRDEGILTRENATTVSPMRLDLRRAPASEG